MESGMQTESKSSTRVYKVVIAILAAAIVIVGALLVVKTFAPSDSTSSALPANVSGSAEPGASVVEVTEDENGNLVYNEREQ